MNTPHTYDTVIIGAGAAGMMCAIQAASEGGRVMLFDHARAAGEKIRISGGGRCNFTNLNCSAANFLSRNPHFAKSALGRYRPQDFIDLVARHAITWHEKTLGQLFCDGSARQIVAMLIAEMARAGAELRLETSLRALRRTESGFALTLEVGGRRQTVQCRKLVVASGGKSIPKMGASGLAYQLAHQFGVPVTATRAALVPLTFGADVMAGLAPLAGVALPARVSCGEAAFEEALLFTHRGLSGPATLQISSFWHEGEEIALNLWPNGDLLAWLKSRRQSAGRRALTNLMAEALPKRLAQYLGRTHGWAGNLADQSDRALAEVAHAVTDWRLRPSGTEGYRTAEVTLGGVDTAALSSRSMEVRAVPGLYFIGEAVDVTGWLGGYNFQWAWSSGWAAGTAIAAAH